jgi:hypothetical protein
MVYHIMDMVMGMDTDVVVAFCNIGVKRMRVLVLVLLLIAILTTVYASESSCAYKCFAEAAKLKGAEKRDALEQCKKTCLPLPPSLPKRTHRSKRVHHPYGKSVKSKKHRTEKPSEEKPVPADDFLLSDNYNQAEEMADASINNGATLEATTGVNIRAGPCTNQAIVGGLAAGQRTTYTGRTQAGCGYTWYSIPNGWVASNFVREVGGGGECRTRAYPLFKQCDAKWANNILGSSSTICQVGCLMSSVSMALNGLGRSIDGQSANPATLNNFLRSNGGYYGNLYVWGAVSRFGLNYQGQPTDKGTINKNICANNVVVLNVNGGGHWVLATGVSADGQTYYVNDPGFNRATYSAGEVVRAGIYSL